MFNHDILAVGNCVKDIFILSHPKLLGRCDRKNKTTKFLSFPYGEKIGVERVYHDLGGEACNAAVAMSKMRTKVAMAAVVGDDTYSREVLWELKKRKIGFRFIAREKGNNLGTSFILLGPDRDRSILAYRTSNDFSKIRIKKLLKRSNSVYLAGINKHSKVLEKDILEYIKRTGKKLYVNPSSYQIEKRSAMLKKLFKLTSAVAVNVEEAQKILKTRKRDIKELLKGIKKMGPELVIITDSKKGAYTYDGKRFLRSGIYPSKRIDTTGAGDAFFSTFVAFYRKDYDMEKCLKLAAINSASVVSVYGAQTGLLGSHKLFERLGRGKVKVRKI